MIVNEFGGRFQIFIPEIISVEHYMYNTYPKLQSASWASLHSIVIGHLIEMFWFTGLGPSNAAEFSVGNLGMGPL